MTTISRTILVVAAASMAVLPVAVQAGTRAGDNGATYPVSKPGTGREAKGERLSVLPFLASLFLNAGLATISVLPVTVAKNKSKSPGAR